MDLAFAWLNLLRSVPYQFLVEDIPGTKEELAREYPARWRAYHQDVVSWLETEAVSSQRAFGLVVGDRKFDLALFDDETELLLRDCGLLHGDEIPLRLEANTKDACELGREDPTVVGTIFDRRMTGHIPARRPPRAKDPTLLAEVNPLEQQLPVKENQHERDTDGSERESANEVTASSAHWGRLLVGLSFAPCASRSIAVSPKLTVLHSSRISAPSEL